MWRREERLKYWLESGGQAHKPSSELGLKEKLFLKLRPCQFANAVKGESLGICANAISLDPEFIKSTQVTDGLGSLGYPECSAREFRSILTDSAGSIRHLELLESAGVLNLQLPNESHARVRQETPVIAPICRSVHVNIQATDINGLESLYSQMPEVKDGKRFLIANPSIQILTSQISELPHKRASIKIDQLQDSERCSFLREAEILKGIPSGRVELLAVFRHVPIEVISRLRLLADQRAILYSISRDFTPTVTRVHDMAAVRDITSQEVLLIPHRTQYRAVSFN